MSRIETHHLSHRSGWLRAAVLGANDGIVSTASLVVGVAAAGSSASTIIVAGVAGLVAGALSMAAGEYVSVSSQRDAERADLRLEARELRQDPAGELRELAAIYEARGLGTDLAGRVAQALSTQDALAAHARDELGLDEARLARPLQAAWTSAASFSVGAALPLLTAALIASRLRIPATVAVTMLGLGALGSLGARLGGAPRRAATARVVAWGAAAMAITAGVGAIVGAVS